MLSQVTDNIRWTLIKRWDIHLDQHTTVGDTVGYCVLKAQKWFGMQPDESYFLFYLIMCSVYVCSNFDKTVTLWLPVQLNERGVISLNWTLHKCILVFIILLIFHYEVLQSVILSSSRFIQLDANCAKIDGSNSVRINILQMCRQSQPAH